MPGFLKLPQSNRSIALGLAILIIAVIAGCSASDESLNSDASSRQLNDFLTNNEKTFNPAVYDADLLYLTTVEQERHASLEIRPVFTTAVPETVDGFRAQVFFTNNIDSANVIRDSVEHLLPGEWTYVVYDVPYYRVRVGNYSDRNEAVRMVRFLDERGFKDAWAVPDKIIINLPKKLSVGDIEAEPRFIQSQ
jgi:hypothetical protein